MNSDSELKTNPDGEFKSGLLAAIPALRAFAASLCGRGDRADDLVQETLVRAWASWTSFEPGSRLQAWLFTILRNEYYSEYRKRRHEVADPEGHIAARLVTHPAQDSHVAFREFQAALSKLSPNHREALILVGASGFSYEQAAAICNCAIGTMKSRVARARGKLGRALSSRCIPAVRRRRPMRTSSSFALVRSPWAILNLLRRESTGCTLSAAYPSAEHRGSGICRRLYCWT
jgi:RNA polymerase sigma-70 factor (ECF subfamily)